MATLVETTVDTGGTGDYSSLNAAEAANWGASGADITAATGTDEYVECTCICTDGQADSTAVTISGMTTDATHDITVTGSSAYRHLGVYPSSGNIYRLDITNSTGITILDDYVRVYNLAIRSSTDSHGDRCLLSQSTGDVYIRRCLFVKTNIGAYDARCCDFDSAGTANVYISNCIAYDGYYGFSFNDITAAYCYNNTAVNCNTGFRDYDGNVVRAKNCIAFNSTTADWTGTFHSDSVTNGYTNGQSGPTGGSNAIDLGSAETVVFNAPGSDIFHLVEDSPARGVGTDLSGDANLAITDDILGGPRPTTPSIGAHEYQVLIPTTAREPLSKSISKWSLDAVRNQPTYHP